MRTLIPPAAALAAAVLRPPHQHRTSQHTSPGKDRGPRRGLPHRAVLTAGAAAALLGPALWAAGPANADTNPACPNASASTATSCTYASTGAEQTFTVPSGVTAVTVHAVGAPGGTDTSGATAGGNGAAVTATVPLPTGTTTLYVEVGGPGTQGGFNGGGVNGGDGGNGGGASDVRTTSINHVPTPT
jgi:hypothetical protein